MNLVWPMLAQVILVLGVGLALGWSRYDAARRRKVSLRDIALDDRAWPENVRKLGNNFRNQFETPVLFFVLSGLAIYLNQDHLGMAVAAWGFVASRVAHTAEHVGRNNLLRRFQLFILGMVFLIAMLVMILAGLISAAAP